MKLEELRQRFREPECVAPVRAHGRRSKKRRKRAQSVDGLGFGISVELIAHRPRKYRCTMCRKKFEPDPKLGYIPSCCVDCDPLS